MSRRDAAQWLVLLLWWVPVGSTTPPPQVLRVQGVVLVDAQGHEVGRWVTTPRGVELVLGGESQASLVTDGEVAALNLLATTPVVRAVETASPEE